MARTYHLARPKPVLAARVLVALGLALACRPASASPTAADAALCTAAIAAADRTAPLPPHVLLAIGQVESGRPVPGTRTIAPWPWTIDVDGVGHLFETKAAAMAAVRDATRDGAHSIDVGCMQISLRYHPAAFASLEDAFDPALNVAYAARLLALLHQQTGDWASAVADYHSATPQLGGAYAQLVAVYWPEARAYGLTASLRPRAPPAGDMMAAALAAEVDPNHSLTPEFRARMIAAAAFRHQREATLLGTMSGQGAGGGTASGRAPRPTPRMLARTALEDEVDPHRVLSESFRAQMVAAAAFRHRQAAGAQEPQAAARPWLRERRADSARAALASLR